MSQKQTQIVTAPSSPSEAPAAYRFAIEYSSRDGRRLGQICVEPDFQPAREWAHFAALRRGRLPATTAPTSGPVVPVWSEDLGEPYCRGVRVPVNGDEGAGELPTEFLQELAEEKVSLYVESGELEEGERYRYRVCAYPVETPPAEPPTTLGTMQIQADTSPLPLAESSLDAFLERSQSADEDDPGDPPVFLEAAVLEETCALAQKAGELETGGVLVGRLHRNPSRPEVFAEVAAQIPARHAAASTASFAFTPETWAAADAAVALRGAGELFLGWWHSHPRFCRNCPEERWRTCLLARPFFSPDDVHLHRTCFPQAYQLGLLISDLPDAGPTPALFGWRMGKVVARGYRVLGGTQPTKPEEKA